jgi:hypothetical protein
MGEKCHVSDRFVLKMDQSIRAEALRLTLPDSGSNGFSEIKSYRLTEINNGRPEWTSSHDVPQMSVWFAHSQIG